MNLSIIIPAFNESESLNELHEWISKVVKRMNIIYEVIIIDDVIKIGGVLLETTNLQFNHDHYRFASPSEYWISTSVATTAPGEFFPITISEIQANPNIQ